MAAAMPPQVGALAAEIGRTTYLARFPSPPFDTQLGELEQGVSNFMASSSIVIRRRRKGRVKDVDIRPMVHELAVIARDQVILSLATGSNGSVKPTEVLHAALTLEEAELPLIRIHKVVATLSSGGTPEEQAIAMTQVINIEKRNTNYGFEPTRNACGYPGG
jgi:hypothetical protein